MYRTVMLDEAVVKIGAWTDKGGTVVMKGRTFVIPFVQQGLSVSLANVTLKLELNRIPNGDGNRVSIDGTSIFRVAKNEESVRKAFARSVCPKGSRLGVNSAGLFHVANEIVCCHLRLMIAKSHATELCREPSLVRKTADLARPDLHNLGLELVQLVITDLRLA